MGRIENQKVLEFYQKNFVNCFITTSSTEGCPVSIMEALSFGIPVIATSVGGITEMIEGTENILLSATPSIDEIKTALISMFSLSEDKNKRLRNANRLLWKEQFAADTNNAKWIEFLKKL